MVGIYRNAMLKIRDLLGDSVPTMVTVALLVVRTTSKFHQCKSFKSTKRFFIPIFLSPFSFIIFFLQNYLALLQKYIVGLLLLLLDQGVLPHKFVC